MDLLDSHLTKLVVDGQDLVLPDKCGWKSLLRDPHLDGLRIGVRDLLWPMLLISTYYPDVLRIALYRYH